MFRKNSYALRRIRHSVALAKYGGAGRSDCCRNLRADSGNDWALIGGDGGPSPECRGHSNTGRTRPNKEKFDDKNGVNPSAEAPMARSLDRCLVAVKPSTPWLCGRSGETPWR